MVQAQTLLRKKGDQARRTFDNTRAFLDGPDYLYGFLAVLVFIVLFGKVSFESILPPEAVSISLSQAWSPTTMAVAIFTALYVFVAQKQLRQSPGQQTKVRPEYGIDPETDKRTFGLWNVGPGTALYLRVYATVVEETDGNEKEDEVVDTKVVLEEDDPPINLLEGDFQAVIDDDFPTLEPEYDDRVLKLYYSFESQNGIDVPPGHHNPRRKTHQELSEDAPDPRSIKLGRLREHCGSENERLTQQ